MFHVVRPWTFIEQEPQQISTINIRHTAYIRPHVNHHRHLVPQGGNNDDVGEGIRADVVDLVVVTSRIGITHKRKLQYVLLCKLEALIMM